MTQMDDAKKGIITEEMKAVAKAENVTEEFIRK
ncbi:MAG: phosphomethylpyrimidine synthase ThiC, partial [Methanobacterium sp.]